jgi:membrane-associated PAP2 superfamily phosphatase
MFFAKTSQFWRWHLGLPLLLAAFMLWLYPATSLDANLIAPYFDAPSHSFPLSHHWFFENVMHTGLKYCMIIVAVGVLLAWLAGFKFQALQPLQQQYLWVFVGMVLATSVVSILKHSSIHGCPHDLTLYGGNLPLLGLFEHLPAGIQAGHCFPGGHASGGFALMAFYFAFREQKPTFAKTMLALGLLMGFAMGWTQMMRGEHFLSHNLWTAWVVWMVLLALSLLTPMLGLMRKQGLINTSHASSHV